MARLSHDALMLLAYMRVGEVYTIKVIAHDVFNGVTTRAKEAARALHARKQAKVMPNTRFPETVRARDETGGSIQVQAVMNFMVRGGIERRKNPDRRAEPHPDAEDRRAADERRDEEATVPRLLRKRIIRPVATPATPSSGDNTRVKQPSPFDIKFSLK